jgi:hypothetical protein
VAGLFEWYFGDAETQLMRLAVVGVALGGEIPGAADVSDEGADHA